jgi:hypothetical protein
MGSTKGTSPSVIFEHDGPGGFGDEIAHVRGLSNVFQSTKSIGSVGFMGFGFKTIYKRFQTVTVSDVAGWRFKFHVGERQLQLGPQVNVYSRSWLGAVCPTWDDTINAPSHRSENFLEIRRRDFFLNIFPSHFGFVIHSYTTRFEMSLPASTFSGTPLTKDLDEAFFQDGSCTVMAILATQGLKEIKLTTPTDSETRVWRLQSFDSHVAVNEMVWDAYKSEFEPSLEALQCLCQARLKNIIAAGGADEVWARLSTKRHKIVALVERGAAGAGNVIAPKQGGQLFATLPIQARVPLGMAIQAEWLLDLSRSGLRDLDSNAWQKSIVEHIADLVAAFCTAIPSKYATSAESIVAAFKIISSSDYANAGNSAINVRDSSWLSLVRKKLEGVNFLPVISDAGATGTRFSVRPVLVRILYFDFNVPFCRALERFSCCPRLGPFRLLSAARTCSEKIS